MAKAASFVGGPIISGLKALGKTLFGGAKKAASNIAQTAITNAASGATQAIQTGDIKGSAKKAWSATKSTAITSAKEQFAQAKTAAKAEATKRVAELHRNALSKVRASGASVGAGWGKAEAKRAERMLHKHINKIFAGAHKHVRASRAHVRKHGRKGATAMKKKTKTVVGALHKEAGSGWDDHLAGLKARIKKSKGAGVKVGAGVKKRKKKGAGAAQMLKRVRGKIVKRMGTERQIAEKIVKRMKKKKGSGGYKAKSGGCP